jgi:hypothetical protein
MNVDVSWNEISEDESLDRLETGPQVTSEAWVNATIEKLIELQKSSDLTEAELGQKAGFSRVLFRGWRIGRAKPSLDSLLAVLAVLDTDPSEFFEHVEQEVSL